jgi:hypothetical protein
MHVEDAVEGEVYVRVEDAWFMCICVFVRETHFVELSVYEPFI